MPLPGVTGAFLTTMMDTPSGVKVIAEEEGVSSDDEISMRQALKHYIKCVVMDVSNKLRHFMVRPPPFNLIDIYIVH